MFVKQLKKNYKLVHRSPAKCGTSSSLFTNFKRRLSTSEHCDILYL